MATQTEASQDKSAATLTIHRAAEMTDEGAHRIAVWLRRQAKMLERSAERKVLADRFRARYLYRD